MPFRPNWIPSAHVCGSARLRRSHVARYYYKKILDAAHGKVHVIKTPHRMFNGDIAVGQDGRIFVTDFYEQRIQVFNPLGTFLRHIDLQFAPRGIQILPSVNGDLVVSDFYYQRIHILTTEGVNTRSFRCPSNPTHLAVDRKGRIVAVHSGRLDGKSSVLIFRPNGDLILQFGEKGSGRGQFKDILGLAITPTNDIALSDCLNSRVEIFSELGEHKRSISVPDLPGSDTHPSQLMCDGLGNLLICCNPGSLKILDADFSHITTMTWTDGLEDRLLNISPVINFSGHLIMSGELPASILTSDGNDTIVDDEMPCEGYAGISVLCIFTPRAQCGRFPLAFESFSVQHSCTTTD